MTLSGMPYRQPGQPAALPPPASLAALPIMQSADGRDLDNVILALRTLGTFDFSGHSLQELVRDYVVLYLEDDNTEIRRAAAQTCCRVLARESAVPPHGGVRTSQVVADVLEKLLTVGITDPGANARGNGAVQRSQGTHCARRTDAGPRTTEPTIRQTVLESLNERFDNYLCQAENVRALFIALNDEAPDLAARRGQR